MDGGVLVEKGPEVRGVKREDLINDATFQIYLVNVTQKKETRAAKQLYCFYLLLPGFTVATLSDPV